MAKREFNAEQLDELETLAAVLSQDQIADYFGMARPTLAALMARDEKAALRYKKGKAKAISDVGSGLLVAARGGNMTAAIFYLKTQGGWRETDRLELAGHDGAALAFTGFLVERAAKPDQA